MVDSIYIGEAAAPRPLQEHEVRARQAWDRIQKLIDTGDSVTGQPITDDQVEALHGAAVKGFWLYPLVCLVLGKPRRGR